MLPSENHDACQNSNPLEATFDVQNLSAFSPSFTTSSADYSQDLYRPIQDWSPITSSIDTYVQPMHQSENHNASESSNSLETTLSQDVQRLSAFSPGFTSLLMNCYPVTEQATQPSFPEEVNLKNEIMVFPIAEYFHVSLLHIFCFYIITANAITYSHLFYKNICMTLPSKVCTDLDTVIEPMLVLQKI